MNILVVEDEKKVASFITKGLEVNGFQTEIAYDGHIAISKGNSMEFDAIIMDINLPGVNGLDVCRQLREHNIRTPILMLTALGTVKDKIKGFDYGADDYLVKPFEFEELLARIKALIKRAKAAPMLETILRVADLELDGNSKVVRREGKEIKLTAKEFLLLEYLMQNKGKVLSRRNIAEKIWDVNFDSGTNIIDLYIYYLRQKIDKNHEKKLIYTQSGMGYVIKGD